MPLFKDARGLAVTAADPAAVAAIDASIAAFLAFRLDTGDRLKPGLAADPACVFANVLRGYYMMLMGNRTLVPRAAKSLAAAQAAAAGATRREQDHVAALAAWVAGDFAGAIRRWEAILPEHPRDAIALRLANFGHFYLGDAEEMRASFARCLHAWDERVPGYGFMLGAYAFAQEEAGDYAAAERDGRRAVEIHPHDVWATHAVAHVMEMQGRADEGVAWITGLEGNFGECHNFTNHLWWHRALFHWDRGRHDAALALYDRQVRTESTDDSLDIANAASFLWRLENVGVAVGGRWDELAARAAERIDDHMLVFADAHFAMALAAAGKPGEAERFAASCRSFAAAGETESQVMREAGADLVDGILAYRAGDYGRAVDRFLAARPALARIGGSRAQRDVFQQMLALAALRADRLPLARALWSERTRLKPWCGWSWGNFAEVLSAAGEPDAAAGARARAAAIAA
ncbi:tetratricopeptide repeat protein [Stella sp.]|uniref:tetratricopeptide repeat protein n=1 Tax=Stella sp. TaxID=2912054 RepID=UPI0035B41F0C